MPLRLSLAPTQASFCPGDVLTATLEVANERSAAGALVGPIELAGVNVDFSGAERIDRSWVSAAYQPEPAPGGNSAAAKEGRREVRQILRTPPARLVMQDYTLMPDEARVWLLRFWLPSSLPPSFKGVAARYSYALTGTAQFALPKQAVAIASAAAAVPGPPSTSAQLASSGSAGALDSLPAAASAQGANGSTSSASMAGGCCSSAAEPLPTLPSLSMGNNTRAPSTWQTAETSASVHLWPRLDPNDRRGGAGAVAAGEDAELQPVAYSMAYPARELTVDFQEIGRGDDAGGASSGGFSFQQLPGADQNWQPAFVASLDRQPSSTTPTFAAVAAPAGMANEARSGAAGKDSAGDESAATPISELTLHSPGETEDAEAEAMPHSAGGQKSARSTLGRQGSSLTTPRAGAEPALRSYNLRLGDAALVRVALHAPTDGPVALGSMLAGTLDFRAAHEAAAANPGVVVLLETEEVVAERWQSSNSARSHGASIRKVWDEHVEVTTDLVLSHFMFSLPVDAPASFATHLVSLRWVLRFEFTTSVAKPAGWLTGGGTPERIAWSLPVLVCTPAVSSS